jgi:hypothetical protein
MAARIHRPSRPKQTLAPSIRRPIPHPPPTTSIPPRGVRRPRSGSRVAERIKNLAQPRTGMERNGPRVAHHAGGALGIHRPRPIGRPGRGGGPTVVATLRRRRGGNKRARPEPRSPSQLDAPLKDRSRRPQSALPPPASGAEG